MGFESNIINAVEENCRKSAKWNDGDYMKDGLHYCGKCNTPKQTRIHLPFLSERRDRIVYCICKCEAEKDAEAKRKRAEIEAERKFQEYKSTMIVDEKYRAMTFANVDKNYGNVRQITLAMQYTEKWQAMKDNRYSMVFSGNCGLGKTFVAGCIANSLLDKGVKVYMETMVDMVEKASNFDTADEIMYHIENCDLLIIDDFGAERKTEFASEKVFKIIDKRIRSNKPMIITTNLTREDLYNPKSLTEQRIFSRIVERASIIEFTGVDIRLKQSQDNTKNLMDTLFG